MNSFKKLFSRQFYRSLPFWLITFLALYSVIGFFVLPKVIHNVISEQVTQHLGWQTEIKKIELNPFLFTLTIHQLAIKDKQDKALSFSRFHADFELRSLIEWAFTFKNIELIEPSFNLIINPDGSTNIQQALAEHIALTTEPKSVKPKIAQPFMLPKLLFDHISVKNGQISATDHSQSDVIKHQIDAISFDLIAFSTYVKKGGDYQLHLSLGNNQSLDWQGTLSVAPLSSQGEFKIQGIRAHRFWTYIKRFAPYSLTNADVSLQANYALSYINGELQLQLDNAFVILNEIKVAIQKEQTDFVTIKQIKIGPSKFDLIKQSVAIETITVEGVDLELLRNQQGELTLLQPLKPFLEKEAQTPSTTSSSFLWSINSLNLKESQVNIVDNAVKGGSIIKLKQINARLEKLNQSLSNQQPFSLSFYLENQKRESSQQNRFKGELVAQPFSLNSEIKLSAIPINLIQPYLDEFAHISIKKGSLSIDGNTSISINKNSELAGAFKGNIDITDFDSSDKLINQRLLGWQKLAITPIDITFFPLVIDIKKINLNKPYSRLIISEQRKINFSQLMMANNRSEQTEKPSTNIKIDIAEINIKEGSSYFADLSLRPQFSTSIQNMNGTIKGLSSNNLERADVNIHGTVEEYGKMSVRGKMNPLSGDLYTDIEINFDKIELTTLTPYAGRYAGYVIDKGKLSLALHYKIANGLLDGKNRLILEQFELGEAVESEESLGLPIKLALALFKDSDGIIDISLPTKGDMNNPDFEISGLIVKALVNVMTKAISSPFSLLANLVGGDEQSLNSVTFELGSTHLNQQQKDNLKTLSELLKKRPQLILEIRVNVDSKQETLVLKQQQLITELELQGKNQPAQIQLMEKQLTTLQGKKSLDELNNKLVATFDAEQKIDDTIFEKQYHQALLIKLITLQPFASLQLTELAQQRISTIKKEIIKINLVDNKQIFALHPSLKGSAEENKITTTFTLTSQ
ncbi:DUF748 domain-containing protein [Psychromonas hadalis]|uniref:DUF748 domain-containing protein n=1 Tax=Psychromonas hadalis TaxID=211669 RepID=UPI0003B7A69D|nr:DUF748 domain-containing protein [Psychromonas hadalis]